MKKIFMMLSLMVLMSCCNIFARNYNVPQSTASVTIDGTLSAGEWDDAIVVIVEYPDIITAPKEGTMRDGTVAPDNAADFSTLIYLKWDSSNLYIAFEVQDDIYTVTAGQDEPQLCFNLLNNPSAIYVAQAIVWNLPVQGTINPNGGLAPNASSVLGSVVTGGYIVESKIAWADFASIQSYSPSAGDIHGIGFALQDHENGTREHFFVDFGSGELTMTDPTSWNTITLVNQVDLALGDWGYLSADFDKNGDVNLSDFALIAQQWADCTHPQDENCSDLR